MTVAVIAAVEPTVPDAGEGGENSKASGDVATETQDLAGNQNQPANDGAESKHF